MEYFTISELIKSDTAIKRRVWNGATREEEDNLIALVDNVLDPLRRAWGKPITVTSGYRNKEVNKSAGGVTGSQHLVGEAADIVTKGGAKNIYELGRLIVARGAYDQVIFENVGKNDLLPEWIHVSWKRGGRNRGNILKKIKGEKAYQRVSRNELKEVL